MNAREFSEALDRYADVAINVGVNLQRGQKLSIISSTDTLELARKLTVSAYRAGAEFVDVLFWDGRLERLRFEHAQPESLAHAPEWLSARYLEYWAHGDASLIIASVDPHLLEGIDPELVAAKRKAEGEKYKAAWDHIMRADINWCVVAGASPEWARQVFPGASAEQAEENLWEEIFMCCRIDRPDPVQAWKEHIEALENRSGFLNQKTYTALHYKGPDTDFLLGLPEGQKWVSGRMRAGNGIDFTANLPTEEVFSMPHREKAAGFVGGSRPLNLGGNIIEDFHVAFENGHVTRITAKQGEERLQKLVETDEGAGRLGEVALVPNSSPVSQRNRSFYSILIDENAASHLALGEAYPFTMRGGNEMSAEEFKAHGGNQSLIHVDFMIGSGEMDIDGVCADGTREPVMRQGEWAFDV